ncbi:hypothetical protein [Aminobacter ciceronei]|uniref:hypothetical protein n=1 Tax=Aminobacter ciceronei TaxID=150723 RepID=UPI001AED1E28|nr:hypothetical protein [Aminobacter ciceronei]
MPAAIRLVTKNYNTARFPMHGDYMPLLAWRRTVMPGGVALPGAATGTARKPPPLHAGK